MVWLVALRDRLQSSLWFLPLLFAAAAAALAVVLLAVDRELSLDAGAPLFMYGGTAEGARSILSTIAQSMLTFTGLVFTITMLVLQLASSQLSPRVMRTFLRDRGNQVVLGLFIATFLYTLLILREVRTPAEGDAGFVPALSIWFAFALLIASLVAFIYYIDHMAHAIRASTVIESIWQETVAAIERLFPERVGSEAVGPHESPPSRDRPGLTLKATGAGFVVAIDEKRLLDIVGSGDRTLELVPRIGDFVAEEAPLARQWGGWDRDAAEQVRSAIAVGNERTLEQDAAFGLRQLVDIALRALSPGVNDPTTASQALDRIHDLLRRLARRRIPSPHRYDDGGRLRLILPRPGWADYVALGLDEIRLAGEGQVQIEQRMRETLEDLLSIAPDDRREPLRARFPGWEGSRAMESARPTPRI